MVALVKPDLVPAFCRRYRDRADPQVLDWAVTDLHRLIRAQAEDGYEQILAAMGRNDDAPLETLAVLGQLDRWFLLTRTLRQHHLALHPRADWLYARCREVEASPDDHLDLWARDHRKTTIITFGGTLQEIVRDPEITVGLFAHTRQIAKAFLRQIKREFESNGNLKAIYPDVCWLNPAEESPKWSEDEGITVKRAGNPKEATVEASGLVDGQPTSKHYVLRVYDDVVTRESVATPEQVAKTTEAWELSDNLGSRGGRRWHIGTRYSFADSYATMLDRKVLKSRIYPATDNGRLDGNPVLLSPEEWAEKRKSQPRTISAQMLQNPVAGEDAMFDIATLKTFEVRPATLHVYILCDPSKGRTNRSDRTAIMVVGVDGASNKYLLDGYVHRMNLAERWTRIRDLNRKWSDERGVQHVTVGYERYGLQSDLEYFEERQRIEDETVNIVEVAWPREGGPSKEDRVGRLVPDVLSGKLRLPALVWHETHGTAQWKVSAGQMEYAALRGETSLQRRMREEGQPYRLIGPLKAIDETRSVYDLTRELIEEMRLFPFGPRKDAVDALSRIYDVDYTPPQIVKQADIEPPAFYDS